MSWIQYTNGSLILNHQLWHYIRIIVVGSKSLFSLVNPLQYPLLMVKPHSFAPQRIRVAAPVGAGLLHVHSECIKPHWRRRMRACRWGLWGQDPKIMRSWGSNGLQISEFFSGWQTLTNYTSLVPNRARWDLAVYLPSVSKNLAKRQAVDHFLQALWRDLGRLEVDWTSAVVPRPWGWGRLKQHFSGPPCSLIFLPSLNPKCFFLACKIMRDAARKTECKV